MICNRNLTEFTMQKAIIANVGGPMKIIDTAIPAVPEDGALIKTHFAGICHSEMQLLDDDFDLGNGEKFRYRDVFGDKFFQITLGHEISGTVHAFGKNVDPSCGLRIGDHVCVFPFIGCQKCEACLLGMNNICEYNEVSATDIGQNPGRNGGFATYVPVPQCCFLIKVPENIPMEMACLLPCSAATAYSAILKATPQLNKAIKMRGQAHLLVVGAGGLGLWGIRLAKALFPGGKLRISVAEINKEKIDTAKVSGADEGFIWGRETNVEDLVQMTTKESKEKVDAAINFVGTHKTTETALGCLHKGGALIMIGLYGGSMPLKMINLITKSISIVGSRTSSVDELRDVVQLISKEKLQYPNLKFFTLNDINEGISMLREGKITGRAVIKYE